MSYRPGVLHFAAQQVVVQNINGYDCMQPGKLPVVEKHSTLVEHELSSPPLAYSAVDLMLGLRFRPNNSFTSLGGFQ